MSERVAGLLDALALHPRYASFSEGVVALENLAYFARARAGLLALARFSFDLRRVGA